jgi:hypothetical protein
VQAEPDPSHVAAFPPHPTNPHTTPTHHPTHHTRTHPMKLCAILLLLVPATGLALRSYSSVSVRLHTQEDAHTLTLALAKQTPQGTGARARGARDGTMLSMGLGMDMGMDMGMGSRGMKAAIEGRGSSRGSSSYGSSSALSLDPSTTLFLEGGSALGGLYLLLQLAVYWRMQFVTAGEYLTHLKYMVHVY